MQVQVQVHVQVPVASSGGGGWWVVVGGGRWVSAVIVARVSLASTHLLVCKA